MKYNLVVIHTSTIAIQFFSCIFYALLFIRLTTYRVCVCLYVCVFFVLFCFCFCLFVCFFFCFFVVVVVVFFFFFLGGYSSVFISFNLNRAGYDCVASCIIKLIIR